MNGRYRLDGHTAVPVESLEEWAAWYEEAYKTGATHLRRTDLPSGRWISTIFLAIDHAFGGGPPLLFETMIFGPPRAAGEPDWTGEYSRRSSTWAEAEVEHEMAVAIAKALEAEAVAHAPS